MTNNFKLPDLEIVSYTLENGLRVVLNPDNTIPVVSVVVYYDVGSRNERRGRDGFAHLFEHMMFQGSENISKSGHFQLIMKAGGKMNGTTSTERTNYYEVLPANQLPLALWLESDRMRSLKVTQENLDNQREVVKEEKRQRYDNQPYGQIFDILTAMVYQNFANAHSTIGSVEDLDAATLEDVTEFFKVYYAPNNAVLAISGAIDIDETKALIEKYFASIPGQEKPAPVNVEEPAEVAVREQVFEDKLAPLPAFLLGWKIPPRNTPEYKALSLGGKLLFEGESSRLYQKMVKGEESVTQLFGLIDERRGASAVILGALPKPGFSTKQIREMMTDEIKFLSENMPSEEEMQKIRNQLLNDVVRARQSSLSRAMTIGEFSLYDDSPEKVNTELDEYLSVTPEQIRNAVNQYLNTENHSLLDVVPAKTKSEN